MPNADAPDPMPALEDALRDPSLPLDERVAKLVGSMTLPEKLTQMHGCAEPVERLGLPAHVPGIEILHGIAHVPRATVFPQAIGLGATWNTGLLQRIGTAIGDEVRVLHRADPTVSLNTWGPVVNLLRDPRWGRNEEGYSECPVLTSSLATAMCTGLTDGDRPAGQPLKTAPTLKAFVGYNYEARGAVTANIRPRVLREYELRPFEAAIKGGVAASVMLGYNRVNGRPCCVSPYVNDILRAWDPDLVVLSDAWAPTFLAMEHEGYFPDRLAAYSAAVKAGLDIFIDQDRDNSIIVRTLERALAAGTLDESDIDAAVARVLRMRFSLGEFDLDAPEPYGDLDDSCVDGLEHRALAAEAAREAIVLLRNSSRTLPLDKDRLGSVAIIGPLADVLYRDWYTGPHAYGDSPLAALRAVFGEDRVVHTPGADRVRIRHRDGGLVSVRGIADGGVLTVDDEKRGAAQIFEVFDWGAGIVTLRSTANGKFLSAHEDGLLHNDQAQPGGWSVAERFSLVPRRDGCVLWNPTAERFVTLVGSGRRLAALAAEPDQAAEFTVEVVARGADEAARVAADADAAIVFVGNHPLINGREAEDRPDMLLAPGQEAAALAAIGANPSTVVVLVSGYPMTVPALAETAPALLWTSHAGPELGSAIADTLVGRYAPAGRVPQTWPRQEEDLGDRYDFDIIGSRKTYLYSDREPLFPFGHGLTYSEFWYDLRLDRPVLCEEDDVGLRATVTNVGEVDSDEVVQVYWRALDSRHERPLRQLGAFRRIHVPAGHTRTRRFRIPMRELAMWDAVDEEFVVEPGRYEFLLGRSSADIVDGAVLTVRGRPRPARDLAAAPARAIDFDSCHAVELTDADIVSAEAVAAVGAGSWICFRDVAMEGLNTLTAEVCRTDPGWAALEIRADDPVTGRLLGVLPVVGGGGRYDWTTTSCALTGGVEPVDLFLTATGPLRVHRFRLGRVGASACGL
ncbi:MULTISPECIES: glycoside hydrolase family 3 C-terminal domain-containing protein [unclassified Streptomyces]|uniref:glycoside hydrolase family 3 C-terminal domain-containing protein n=2 Tax=Streptomyces TaxID=1883 RepID=UPI002252368F|nr:MULTISPECIES: glycoside hydrolase family 3 C-terminal domain-containing protein [unclassified Streptomyces]MCX5055244.1 glycoside hydrolase family 3 C-terminal domain-containing protein [Streptomyces sp. NBC_00474]